jgi:hypothetical protein
VMLPHLLKHDLDKALVHCLGSIADQVDCGHQISGEMPEFVVCIITLPKSCLNNTRSPLMCVSELGRISSLMSTPRRNSGL